jgi:hypothetical protein
MIPGDLAGRYNLGDVRGQCAVVGGYVVDATSFNGTDNMPLTTEQRGGFLYDSTLEYTVVVELPEGPQEFQRVKTAWPIWSALDIRVKPIEPGTPVIGTRIGPALTIFFLHTPLAAECPAGGGA